MVVKFLVSSWLDLLQESCGVVVLFVHPSAWVVGGILKFVQQLRAVGWFAAFGACLIILSVIFCCHVPISLTK